MWSTETEKETYDNHFATHKTPRQLSVWGVCPQGTPTFQVHIDLASNAMEAIHYSRFINLHMTSSILASFRSAMHWGHLFSPVWCLGHQTANNFTLLAVLHAFSLLLLRHVQYIYTLTCYHVLNYCVPPPLIELCTKWVLKTNSGLSLHCLPINYLMRLGGVNSQMFSLPKNCTTCHVHCWSLTTLTYM